MDEAIQTDRETAALMRRLFRERTLVRLHLALGGHDDVVASGCMRLLELVDTADDATLLRLAWRIERALDWSARLISVEGSA